MVPQEFAERIRRENVLPEQEKEHLLEDIDKLGEESVRTLHALAHLADRIDKIRNGEDTEVAHLLPLLEQGMEEATEKMKGIEVAVQALLEQHENEIAQQNFSQAA